VTSLFLWPRPRPLSLRHWLGRALSTEEVEERLRRLYPDAEPVLFSSARAGLSATLEHLGLGRPDKVWCPPFSSHCVFDAVARVATPTTEDGAAPAVALIYHQWGHVCRSTFPATTILIEDAVDTLLVPGTSPFAIAGRFALWSLPKTIASLWGGVVFCRQADDATALRALRQGRGLPGGLQALLRLAGERHAWPAAYWHGAEATGGKLPVFALRHIADGLDRLDEYVASRRQRLAPLQTYSLAPPPPPSRLPCCLPLPAAAGTPAILASGQALTAGLRNFNSAGSLPEPRWTRVFPAPIHQDVSGTDIAEFVARVNLQPRIQP